MKIDKIKKMNNGKYKIELDNNEKIVTYDNVILKNNLLFDKNIDSNFLNQINKDTEYYNVYNKVIKLISTKVRSEEEIHKYLSKLEIPNSDEKKIITDLKNNGLINDLNFCKAYVSDKMNLSTSGPYKIARELREHKIDEATILDILKEYDESFIEEKLTKLIRKKISSNNKYSRTNLYQKIMASFKELGYNSEMINKVFNNNYKSNSNLIEKEAIKIRKALSKKYTGRELEYKLISKLFQKGFTSEEIDKIKTDI